MESVVHGPSSGGAVGVVPLNTGWTYEVTLDGNFTIWGGTLAQGADLPIKYVSGSGGQRDSSFDAEVQYAIELPTPVEALPRHSALVEMSLDGGATWAHREPVGGPYSAVQPGHVYTYQLLGAGYPLRVRHGDVPLSDNNGRVQVTVVSGIGEGGWTVGFLG